MPVSRLEESMEAHCQATLKTAKDSDGGLLPAYPSGKSWDEASGKTGSGKRFHHNVISGADFSAQPSYVDIIAPVIHYRMGGLEIDEDSTVMRPLRIKRGGWRCAREKLCQIRVG